ncbi:MAG: hypothetical protein WDN45_15095 [Caulobacteraceae bacterium]
MRARALPFAVLTLSAPLVLGAALAAPPAPIKASPQALALARAVRDDRAEAKGVEAQIAHLRQQLTALAAVEAAGERGTGDKRARLDGLTRQEEALAQTLGASQNATSRLLGVLALFRRDPPPALLVHPKSAQDAVRAQILARAMAPALEARSRALALQLDRLRGPAAAGGFGQRGPVQVRERGGRAACAAGAADRRPGRPAKEPDRQRGHGRGAAARAGREVPRPRRTCWPGFPAALKVSVPRPNGWSSRCRDTLPHASARRRKRAVPRRVSPGKRAPAPRSWPPPRGSWNMRDR